jgi:hypothetical protein
MELVKFLVVYDSECTTIICQDGGINEIEVQSDGEYKRLDYSIRLTPKILAKNQNFYEYLSENDRDISCTKESYKVITSKLIYEAMVWLYFSTVDYLPIIEYTTDIEYIETWLKNNYKE